MSLTPLIPNLDPNGQSKLLGSLQPPPIPPMDNPLSSGGMPSLPATLKPLVQPGGNALQRILQEQHYSQEANTHQGLTHSGAPAQGFWQHLGKIAEGIGNVAGDIFAPATMALIPGTQLNRRITAGQGAAGLAGLEKQDTEEQDAASQRALQSAQTGAATEATAEMPGKAASEEGLQGAETYRQMHPLATSDFELWHQQNPNGTAEDYQRMKQKPLTQQEAEARNAVWDRIAAQYHLPTGQFHAGMTGADATALAGSLNNVISRGQGAQGITIKQEQVNEKVPMLAPDGNGGYKLQYVQPGQTVTPGSMTPTQGGTVSVPTTTERTAAGRAQIVHEAIPGLISDIDKNAAALGPVMGRWNDFMQGKAGTNNPEFAALRANLLMASSAVALAHAQGRLPENLREEFDKAINAPQQTPENLKAVLQAIDPWMQQMSQLGTVQGLSPNAPPPAGEAGPTAGTIKEYGGAKYKFKGGDQYDQKNWVKQ